MTPDLAIAWLIFNVFLVGITLVWGIFRYRRGIWYRRLTLKIQAYLLWGIGGVALLSSIFPFAYLYTEHLWFTSINSPNAFWNVWFDKVNYADVFWKLRKIRWGLFAGFFFIALAFMNANAAIANRLCPEPRESSRWTRQRTVSFHRTFFCGTVLLAILFAVPMMSMHDEYLRYTNQPVAPKPVLDNPEVVLEDPAVVPENPEVVPEDPETIVEKPEEIQNSTQGILHFGKDINFYLFSLPMHKAVSLWGWVLLWTTCVVVGLLYNFYYRRDARSKGYVKRHIVFHGSVLWLLLLAVGIWRSYAYLWGKVYTKSATPTLNKYHGLFYMDSQLAGTTFIYCGILLVIGLAVLLNLFWRKRLLWYAAIIVWCVSYISLIHVYPRISHFANVQTDEIETEGIFLEKHIASTRAAFDLEAIQDKPYTAGPATLELVNKAENREVLENIQLWDRRVLYDVLQAEHLVKHHNFYPYTDIDRYRVNTTSSTTVEDANENTSAEQYRQVLIAAREIEPDREVIGGRGNWRNRKLHYTHGYGVYVSPANAVNAVDDKMSPVFWTEVKLDSDKLKNETSSAFPELEVTQPRIYYGEMTNDYVLVNTTTSEYDFESDVSEVFAEGEQQDATETGENNEYHYEGTGGVKLSNWFRRFCFSVRFLDFQILYNKNAVLFAESRIMFWRKIGTRLNQKVISDRLSHIAPFLDYDPDPYIVIADGQLWWIVDFYVTSKWYPNAQFYKDDTAEVPDNFQDAERRYKKFNYIRNPGVAIVNAYSGEVNFYAVKGNEAIMSAYQKTFPNLFKGIDEMPSELQAHLRFPDYLTRIQAKIYKDYHIKDAKIFHGTSRQLKIPKEVYGDGKKTKEGAIVWKDDQEMMPYYAMIRLPGETRMEFVNMIPFTPPEKEFDMKAWLVARCDPPHYGERIVYTLNNTTEVKGPKHVENLITSKLSETFLKLTIGNVVMRSSLQFIPLDKGIFHVEAIYQKPDTGQETEKEEDEGARRPMLVDIAVAANGKLGHDPLFSEAVKQAVQVGQRIDDESDTNEATEATGEEKEPTLAELYEDVQKAMEAFGKALKAQENRNAKKAPAKAAKKKKNNK